jgi:hypothetical protein
LNREIRTMSFRLAAASAAALAQLPGTGCSGNPTADATPSIAAEKNFTADELADMKSKAGSGPGYGALLKIKTMERDGSAKVKYPTGKGSKKG